MLSAVIFDLDGVIIDSERLVDSANESFLKSHGCTYRRDLFKPRAMGKTLMEGTKIMQEVFGLEGSAEKLLEERRELITRMYREKVEFMPGFVPFYDEVVRRGLQSAVATSTDSILLGIVQQKLGLGGMFPGRIFTIAAVGNRSKPDPAVYVYTAAQMGLSPAECLVIEDAPLGIEAAKRAGAKCVAVTATLGPEHLSAADVVVNSFSEIDLDTWTSC